MPNCEVCNVAKPKLNQGRWCTVCNRNRLDDNDSTSSQSNSGTIYIVSEIAGIPFTDIENSFFINFRYLAHTNSVK